MSVKISETNKPYSEQGFQRRLNSLKVSAIHFTVKNLVTHLLQVLEKKKIKKKKKKKTNNSLMNFF